MQIIVVDELEELEFDWSKKPDPLRPVGGRCEATGTCDGPRRDGTHFSNFYNEGKDTVILDVTRYFDSKDAFDLKNAIADSL